MSGTRREDLLEACCLLFGTRLDPSFLDHVQESGLRSAWRRKALQTHPDRASCRAAKIENNERFIEARRAYALLREHLGRRGVRRDTTAPRAQGPAPHRSGQRPPTRSRYSPRPAPDRTAAGVPRRPLRLGEFLYHSRVITYSALIETLVFQRSQRERFCEIALRWRCISQPQVQILLEERLPLERIGETAQRLRLLTPQQVRLVLTFQSMTQEPLGKIFVRRGLLTTNRLQEQLSLLLDHNASLRKG